MKFLNKDLLLKFLPELVSILLFLILIPLYSYVNFYQNDDWNRNTTVLRFLTGDFSLLQVTATTFYSQGLLGFLWAIIFSAAKIPYLTLLVSIGNFYLFWKILQKLNFGGEFIRFLVSLILFTNPLHVYSSIGFMTENYVIFYLLLAIYFYCSEKFYISALFGFLAFYAKQNALIFLVGFSLFFLLKKRFKEFIIFTLFSLFSLISYYFLFPRTSEMRDKDFNFVNFSNPEYIFSLSYGILLYLAFFTLPFLVYYILNFLKDKKTKHILIIVISSISIYFASQYFYKPGLISWEEFPYFENVFERTGFLPRTVDGTKYQFRFNYDFYNYSDKISKIVLSVFLSILAFKLINFKKNESDFINPYLFIVIINFILMFFVSIFFDRYILLFLPFFILYLVKHIYFNKILILMSLSFILYQGYFSYFLASDFIYTHNYIWTKSNEIVVKENINPNQIDATGAWNRNFKSLNQIYVFSYDSPQVNKNYQVNYELIETKDINFKGNLFINPKIYLYKKK